MNQSTRVVASAAVIEAVSLSKRYGDRLVVDGFSINVERGQIFGLLGPNAAGKTTSIRMLCGIIEPDSGDVSIDGTGITDAKGRIGYVAQRFGQYEELTVQENVEFYAEMYGVRDRVRLDSLLERTRWGASGVSGRVTSLAVTSGVSDWYARLRTIRTCCFWMSPRRASTRSRASYCGTSFTS